MVSFAVAADRQTEKMLIDSALRRVVPGNDCPAASHVAEAMEHAVFSGGQRLRPLLAVRVGRAVGGDPELVIRGAAAVELLHCASLIVDDLPCMDNEEFRRGLPAIHRKFGESTALLAAFSLVALAARQTLEGIRDPRTLEPMVAFQRNVLRVLDRDSLVGGQAMDLAGAGPSRQLAGKKTAPLFALAARAGAIGAPLDPVKRQAVVRFGQEFGVAYQMMDDLADGESHRREPFEAQMKRTRGMLPDFGPAAGLHEMLDSLYDKSFA